MCASDRITEGKAPLAHTQVRGAVCVLNPNARQMRCASKRASVVEALRDRGIDIAKTTGEPLPSARSAGQARVAALVAAPVARDLSPVTGLGAVLAATPITVIGLAGDVSAARVKRRAGIMDFREIVPGYGGGLGRFDGLIPNHAVLGLFALLSGAAR